MGQGRGGLYPYDALENLVGPDMHSAEHVVPEWQDVAVGSDFRLHPDVALEVAAVEPGPALVIRGGVPMGGSAPPYDFAWAFVLEGRPDGTTRLLCARALRLHALVVGPAGRAGRGGELRDEPEDVAWDQGAGGGGGDPVVPAEAPRPGSSKACPPCRQCAKRLHCVVK